MNEEKEKEGIVWKKIDRYLISNFPFLYILVCSVYKHLDPLKTVL